MLGLFMATSRCFTCGGTGKIMGGGMIMKDCHTCDSTGKIEVGEKKEVPIIYKKKRGRPRNEIKISNETS